MYEIIEKVKRKIRGKFVNMTRHKAYYYKLYPSYWHEKLSLYNKSTTVNRKNYFAARPNPGAGIGHQMANWISGYWFAKEFALNYAHISFSSEKWEKFLGFYQNEETVKDLKSKYGYKVVRIPLFDEENKKEITSIKKIISSYSNKKVIFLAEQDQFYRNQFGVIEEIREKFESCPQRKQEQLFLKEGVINIAVHVRRGDIGTQKSELNSNLAMRWSDDAYFVNVLQNVLRQMVGNKKYVIYLFSQGKQEDFLAFENFNNIKFCLDMSAQDSFLHMTMADILITSKSSFSYKPALLNRHGIKVVPKDFWHGYPGERDWILVEEDGNFVIDKGNCFNEI